MDIITIAIWAVGIAGGLLSMRFAGFLGLASYGTALAVLYTFG